MNYKVLYGLAALSLAACQNKQYTITMEIPGDKAADNTLVYLSDYETKAYTDSAVIINGVAKIEGQTNANAIRRVYVKGTRLYANIIVEPGNIKVDFDKAYANGTPLNDAMAKYTDWRKNLQEYAGDKYESIMKDTTLNNDDKAMQRDLLLEEYNKSIASHADSIISANKSNSFGRFVFWDSYIQSLNGEISYEQYKAALANAGSYIASFKPIKAGTQQMENYANTQAGAKFVDFTIENGNIDGTSVKFSDYIGKGKVVLVDFWASWCGPCRRAMPMVKAAYEKYAGENFDVLGIAVWDERSKSIEAIENEGMTWNLIIDAQKVPTDIYGIYGIPELILFDKDGTIIDRSFSPSSIDSIIASALNK